MSNEWQNSRQNPKSQLGWYPPGAGRPKKTLKRTLMQPQNADSESQPAPVPSGSRSATHSSFEPEIGRSNVIQHTAKKLATIPLEPEQVDFLNDNTVGVDSESFNPMAIRRRVAEELRSDAYNPSPSSDFDPPSQNSLLTTPLRTLYVSPSIELTSRAPEQTVFRILGGNCGFTTRKVLARKDGGVDVPDAQLLVVRGQQNARGKVDAIIAVVNQTGMKLVINISMGDFILHELYSDYLVFSQHEIPSHAKRGPHSKTQSCILVYKLHSASLGALEMPGTKYWHFPIVRLFVIVSQWFPPNQIIQGRVIRQYDHSSKHTEVPKQSKSLQKEYG
ncbi:hypothetical protein B0H13DRAFT_1908704 [Mycena leptocephala]|nr:hypothetical protein B0H13DRAFT_1908704 [Mycena leptocephala]